MALQQIIPRRVHAFGALADIAAGSALTINATGESLFSIGRVRLKAGSGSKTFSSAGGALYLPIGGSLVFANAGTTLRFGVQDVASGLEDGTFDVFDDYVPGTDTLTASQYNKVTMTSGSKTIAHGDLLAVGMELTARAGTDSINNAPVTNIYESGRQLAYPITSHDSGAGPAKTIGGWTVVIQFDDGTLGWIDGLPACLNLQGGTSVAYNSGSTPDEYALLGSFPYKCTLGMLAARISNVASVDDFELVLYSAPLGTPVAERTVAVTASDLGATDNSFVGQMTPYDIPANTVIGIAMRPTTTNNISLVYYNLQTGNGALTAFSDFDSMGLYSRTNQSGAFALVNALHVPNMYAWQTALDDGASAGGGSHASAYIG